MFITFRTPRDKYVAININHIRRVEYFNDRVTALVFGLAHDDADDVMLVKEPLVDVIESINEALRVK